MSEYGPEHDGSRNVEAFIDGVACRLALRDVWRDAKAAVARVGDDAGEGIDGYRKSVFTVVTTIDTSLDKLNDGYETDAKFFNKRMESELETVDDERIKGLLRAMTSVPEVELGSPKTLLPWARQHRNVIVEYLWGGVEDARDGSLELTKEVTDSMILQTTTYLTKLIEGTTNPTGKGKNGDVDHN